MYLRQLFRILFRTLNHQYDYTFDWTLLKQKAAASASSSSTITGGHALPPAGKYGTVYRVPASSAHSVLQVSPHKRRKMSGLRRGSEIQVGVGSDHAYHLHQTLFSLFNPDHRIYNYYFLSLLSPLIFLYYSDVCEVHNFIEPRLVHTPHPPLPSNYYVYNNHYLSYIIHHTQKKCLSS